MKLAQGGSVERACLHALDAQAPEAGAHLARSAGRERQRKDALRLLRAGVDGIRDAVRDGAGLAGARTGKDAQRARGRARDLPLLGVEPGEDVVGGRCRAQDRSPTAAVLSAAAWSGT
ncbi:hypothetical protein GCM10027053_52840 [Intrasporangium mesophilum]